MSKVANFFITLFTGDNKIAFISGTSTAIISIPVFHISLEILAAAIFSFFGGVAGVGGKDAYLYVKKRIIRHFNKKP